MVLLQSSPETPHTPFSQDPIRRRAENDLIESTENRIFSPEPPRSNAEETQQSLSKLLQEKLSPLVKVRNNSDGADVPQRIQSVVIEPSRPNELVKQSLAATDTETANKPRISIPESSPP